MSDSIWKKEISFKKKAKADVDPDEFDLPKQSILKKELSFSRKPKAEKPAKELKAAKESIWKKDLSLGKKKTSEVDRLAEQAALAIESVSLPFEPVAVPQPLELAEAYVAAMPDPEPPLSLVVLAVVPVEPVELPPVELPPIELAPVELPSVELPSVEMPPVEMPPVEMPPVEMPRGLHEVVELPAAMSPWSTSRIVARAVAGARARTGRRAACRAVARGGRAAARAARGARPRDRPPARARGRASAASGRAREDAVLEEGSLGLAQAQDREGREAPKVKRESKEKSAPFWKKELSLGRKPKAASTEAATEQLPAAPKTPMLKKQLSLPKLSLPKLPTRGGGGGGHSAKRVVGLKIGSSQLAAARISNNGVAELQQLVREPLASGVVVAGELRDPEALGAALKVFFRKAQASEEGRQAWHRQQPHRRPHPSRSSESKRRSSLRTRCSSARRRRCRFRSTKPCSTIACWTSRWTQTGRR